MNKKILALVLAFAMVFSTVTAVFANEAAATAAIGADAEALKTINVLQGAGSGVTAEYLATKPDRLQAAIMFLRLKGLEDEAKAFTGTDNFADGNIAWAEGRAIMAYLKAHPELGWIGINSKDFGPYLKIEADQYYKVLLEALGYKQSTETVVGDFTWSQVMEFAASKGLVKLAGNTNFTVNDFAIGTVEALKANIKGTAKTLIASLIEAGKISEEAAIAAGLAAGKVEAAVDSAKALGNTVVEVTFADDVDAAAANAANYTIEGLAVKAATVAGANTVRLETEAQKAGTLYTLTVGEKSVKFTGAPKVTGAPAITNTVSDDVEKVVITFDKNLDFASATNVANYAIAGVEVVKAEVDGAKVTLTTNGLAARKQYTVKVTNVKSVDGAVLKSASDSFYTRLDTTAPKLASINGVVVETNQRIVVTFNEKVTKESAENVENYAIKTVTGDTELKVLSAKLDTDDTETVVTLTTETQTANKKYEISIINITDQKKAANTITKAIKATFYGAKEDTTAPVFAKAEAIARNLVKVSFTDSSKLDEASILDPNSYTLKKGTEEFAVESVEKVSSKNGEFAALLNVDDLAAGSYSLEAVSIMDEFGNELTSAKKYFTVDNGTFAASTISAATIDDANTITIKFTKALNEASAEDIANYSIDGGIGAPISATYTEDNSKNEYKVVLKTNDLKDNTEYKVTVNGVTDLAGNALKLEVKRTGSGWDADAPTLEDTYSVNKYVVALTFNEAVKFENGATLTLRPEGAQNADNDVVLTAKATANDDTVIEFSNYNTADPASSEVLADNVTYNVYSIVYGDGTGITDIAGKEFVLPADIANYEIYGTNEEPQKLEVVSIAQTNGRTFELTMSGDVLLVAGKASEYTGFDVSVDGNVVTFVKKGDKIADDFEQDFNLSAFLTDKHGIPVLDEGESDDASVKTTFYAEYSDSENPYIVNVVAKDRYHVEIEYSEDVTSIDFDGTYSVKNADTEISKAEMVQSVSVDGNKVTITLKASTPLQAIYDYELKILQTDVKDLAGNTAEEAVNDTFSFNGTDLAPVQ